MLYLAWNNALTVSAFVSCNPVGTFLAMLWSEWKTRVLDRVWGHVTWTKFHIWITLWTLSVCTCALKNVCMIIVYMQVWGRDAPVSKKFKTIFHFIKVKSHAPQDISNHVQQQHVQLKRRHHSTALPDYWAFVDPIYRWPMDSPDKWPAMRIAFPFHYVFICCWRPLIRRTLEQGSHLDVF